MPIVVQKYGGSSVADVDRIREVAARIMRTKAFTKIERCYRKAGARDRQRCRLYDAPHQFNLEMQAEAWEWIRRWV